MRFVTRLLLAVTGIVVFFTIVGFLVLPLVAKPILVRVASEALKREVSLKEIAVNPYTLTVTLRGLILKEPSRENPFLSLDEMVLNLQASSVFSGALVVEELTLRKPYINIVRNKDESYNFSDLLGTRADAPAEKKKPFLFSVNNIVLTQGSIDFFDGPKEKKHTVRDLNITLPFISNVPRYISNFVQPAFSAVVNGDEYKIQGKTKPFEDSHETELDISIKDVDFPTYLAYVPMKLPFRLPSGAMDLDAKITYIEHKKEGRSVAVAGKTVIRKLAINDLKDSPLLRLPSVEIGFDKLEPLSTNIRVSRVALQGTEIMVKRDKEGVLNLTSLAGQMGESGGKKDTKKAQPSPPTYVTIDECTIENGKVTFVDELPEHPVTVRISDVKYRGENLSTVPGSKANITLSLRLNEKGTVSVNGPLTIDPLGAELSIDTRNITIAPFQPYFTDRVRINVTSGSVSTKGTLQISSPVSEPLAVKYTGNVLVTEFGSIDKAMGEEFVGWKTLSLDAVDAGTAPLHLYLKGISLSDFYAKVAINSDGTINLQKVTEEAGPPPTGGPPPAGTGQGPKAERVKGSGEGAPPPAAKAETTPAKVETGQAMDIKVDTVTLQGGTIDFSDKWIKPSFSAHLTEMGGRVSGLSFRKGERAEVELKGKLNTTVTVDIKGKVNPSKEDFFADVTMGFRGLDLSPMTPYSGKFIGYAIEKGKLAIDLKYLIQGKKLESENVIFIDQLTLGEKIESPDAVSLPVRLAIALLKDRNGEIKLDIPVTGSLDDPKFSIGGIIWKIVVNLITKAVTSPFALLGALFGGGEELSYVEFDYGRDTLGPENQKKAETLVKALFEKPSLKMDIEGHVDMEKDKEALTRILFERKIKVQKLNELIKKGSPAVPVDDVKIEPQEQEKYLTMAYKAETFAKPKNVVGLAKSLPAAEMEKLMVTHIEVKDEDLRALAGRRASRVKDLIVQSGQVTPDRVFIVEPRSLSPEKKEKLKNSRADFKIK
jgi:hypothetical protein